MDALTMLDALGGYSSDEENEQQAVVEFEQQAVVEVNRSSELFCYLNYYVICFLSRFVSRYETEPDIAIKCRIITAMAK
uniref:Uncharacterized protein n=1 Tax=Ditylenchus dipsaci TaxID=166011 RepID=A0A915DWE9_9BILA